MTAVLNNNRVSVTQRNTRPSSRVEIERENSSAVAADLVNFETRQKGAFQQFKYPNIELKRCFDAKQFRRSNKQITLQASTRSGSMRSYLQTTVPRKHRKDSDGGGPAS